MNAPATNLDAIWPFQLRAGHSDDPTTGACLLDAVSWFEYGCLDDHPPCVSPTLIVAGIALNDMLGHIERQSLRKFILTLPGTNDGHEKVRERLLVTLTQRVLILWKSVLIARLGVLEAARHAVARFEFYPSASNAMDVLGTLHAAGRVRMGVWVRSEGAGEVEITAVDDVRNCLRTFLEAGTALRDAPPVDYGTRRGARVEEFRRLAVASAPAAAFADQGHDD